jgi:hypothetical protein
MELARHFAMVSDRQTNKLASTRSQFAVAAGQLPLLTLDRQPVGAAESHTHSAKRDWIVTAVFRRNT